MGSKLSIVALIPARSGSKRVKNKNINVIGGHPLIAYTIYSAMKANIFDDIIVSTDSEKYSSIAKYYGATVPFMRPQNIAGDNSPDIDWVSFTLDNLEKSYDCFSILRPTSPFRTSETIIKAWSLFNKLNNIDSIRAVEKCTQHPAKMWTVKNNLLESVMEGENSGVPWHSSQYLVLPEVYVQNASLEIAWTKIITSKKSISGNLIAPFFTSELEGFDINKPQDWVYANHLIKTKKIKIDKAPYK